MPSDDERDEGGVNICNEERTYNEEDGVGEESYDKEEVGNDYEVTNAVGIGGESEEYRGVEE